ncbi:MAG TPA: hypothetical protein VMM78_05975 [Thermomicrobiales bacterium]|nr:hypothetical protein [Thermomicrobiales bacterium]
MWGHEAGSHNPGSHAEEWNLPSSSRITAVEAAMYLDVPNLLIVRYNGKPELPYDQLAIATRPMRRVMWSVTGAMGEQSPAERDHVFDIARRFPNVTGVVMDDFINWDTGKPELSPDELKSIHRRLTLPDRTLDLMMVLYSHQLDIDVSDHLEHCNQVSFWVWDSQHLEGLDADFARFEASTPGLQRFLGCYVWDFGARAQMPLEQLQRQCATGLDWLREGRISGMIFLPSCHCDLELDTVEWLRGWIASVGNTPLA